MRFSLQVALYALVMGLAGLIFFYIGVSMGWLYVSHGFIDWTSYTMRAVEFA